MEYDSMSIRYTELETCLDAADDFRVLREKIHKSLSSKLICPGASDKAEAGLIDAEDEALWDAVRNFAFICPGFVCDYGAGSIKAALMVDGENRKMLLEVAKKAVNSYKEEEECL